MSADGLQFDLDIDRKQKTTVKRAATNLIESVGAVLFDGASVALLLAAVVLSIGVVSSQLFGRSLKWQDEVAVYLVLGAVFISAARVQSLRGHISIDLFDQLLTPRSRKVRALLIDGVSLIFCFFLAWQSVALLIESVNGGYSSPSPWGPPLWVPYSLMAFGMVLLAARIAAQMIQQSVLMTFLCLSIALGCLLLNRPATPLLTGVPIPILGISFCVVTMLVMFSGVPIAFALGSVALGFMLVFMPRSSVGTIAQNVYEELANLSILAIPLFILKGATIGRSAAGRDLYSALHAWLCRVPGGLGIANTIACGLFAAMAGSSVPTCSAIGSAGIPEMRKRGYSPGFAAGIIAAGGTLGILLPPSVTMLLFAVAAEVSLGKLFLAGLIPGLMLIISFATYAALRYRKEKQRAQAMAEETGIRSAILASEHYTFNEKIRMLAWVAPFVLILVGVMIVLYAGLATPSETAGVGAVLALAIIGLMYRIWRPSQLMPILISTMRESCMLLMIIGMSLLYSYVMSFLHISQAAAAAIIALHLSKWLLLASVLLLTVCLGFILPPVSIILMTSPIILPPLREAGFDLVWFGVVMMIIMEMGLIHPPVGLNIFVIKSIAPDIPLRDIVWGTLPFVLLMIGVVLLCCLFPTLVMCLPQTLIG